MYKLFVFALLLACVAADHHQCGILQRLKVKQQWSKAFGFGDDRMSIGMALWRGIFQQHPEAVDKFFSRVNGNDIHSPEFQAHIARVFGGFDMSISLLDDEATLKAELAHLAEQHARMGITGEYLNTFRKSLMTVVAATLHRCFDHDAWDACTEVIADGISGH
jgi:hemoglobin-like flavoprotein